MCREEDVLITSPRPRTLAYCVAVETGPRPKAAGSPASSLLAQGRPAPQGSTIIVEESVWLTTPLYVLPQATWTGERGRLLLSLVEHRSTMLSLMAPTEFVGPRLSSPDRRDRENPKALISDMYVHLHLNSRAGAESSFSI